MTRPKRYQVLVEVTDMTGMLNGKRVTGMVRELLRLQLNDYALGGVRSTRDVFANIQAKDPRRVNAAKR